MAELVLGIVPIVLEALKQYGTLCNLCQRFKECKTRVNLLLDRLEVQQVIFQNATSLLLKGALGSETASVMVEDLTDPLWQDMATRKRVNQYLGSSKTALEKASQMVINKMRCLAEQLEAVRLVEPKTQDRKWRKEVKKRFKLAFSEDKLNEVADSITAMTTDYCTLRSQLREKAIHEPEPAPNFDTQQANLERVIATRIAAQRIYQVLAIACHLHTKHHAHFSLRPQYTSRGVGMEIKFHLAYRHLSKRQVQGSQDVLWFEVESILSGTVSGIPRSIPVTNEFSRPSKRSRSPATVSIQGVIQSPRRRVRFRSPSPTTVRETTAGPSAPALGQNKASVPLLPDLAGRGDFCRQVRACCQSQHLTGTCIGMLENSNHWQHRLYPSSAPASHAVTDQTETLSGLFRSIRKDAAWNHGISPTQRLRLAKLLSMAVLSFHATPWMQSSWGSDDIFLYGIDRRSLNHLQRELDAFIEVPVDVHTGSLVQHDPDALSPFVRNSTLFSLGVMLVELAFEKPIKDMVNSRDRAHGHLTPEYHAAMRLSKEVSTRLGARYSKIVEQCLFCTFGHGTELDNLSLQSAIHENVVLELDRLATDFHRLTMC